MVHQLIASPYPDGHIVVSPGRDGGIRLGPARYAKLQDTPADAPVPSWLAAPARAAWGLDLAGRNVGREDGQPGSVVPAGTTAAGSAARGGSVGVLVDHGDGDNERYTRSRGDHPA